MGETYLTAREHFVLRVDIRSRKMCECDHSREFETDGVRAAAARRRRRRDGRGLGVGLNVTADL